MDFFVLVFLSSSSRVVNFFGVIWCGVQGHLRTLSPSLVDHVCKIVYYIIEVKQSGGREWYDYNTRCVQCVDAGYLR